MNRFDIGRRIGVYRDKLDMSTQELAEKIHRSQATISRIENGKQGLTFELLSRIASELHVHPFSLLSDEPVRASVLMSPPGRVEGEHPATLLANALHGGRIRRRMKIETAAEVLHITASDLESVEMAMTRPEEPLLSRLCELYGLSIDEVRELKRLGAVSPRLDHGLAYLQLAFSRIYHIACRVDAGDERKALDRIVELLDRADHDCSLPPDGSPEDIGLFLNRLSLHLVKALRDKDFRDNMLSLAGLGGQPCGKETETAEKPGNGQWNGEIA